MVRPGTEAGPARRRPGQTERRSSEPLLFAWVVALLLRPGRVPGETLIPGKDLDRPHRPPCRQVDVLGNKEDVPVGQEDVHSPRVPAPRGGGQVVETAAGAGQVEVGPVVGRGAV